MVDHRFGAIARALRTASQRREVVGLLLGGAFGATSLEASKANKKKKKKKITVCLDKQTLEVPKKKKGAYLNSGATLGACASSPPPPPPPPAPGPTCNDGIRNGTESDIDCGGSCPRCPIGRACNTKDDCASALCVDNVCRVCSGIFECGEDAGGLCTCAQGVCAGEQGRTLVGNCNDECPPGTDVCDQLDQFAFACRPLCGRAIPG